jgi:probable 2-oxoglutarate dehydrogenase E1 component DHKTD1
MHEGYDIRVSGQDVGRGTFSQRHAMLVDQKTEKVVVPLNEFLPVPSAREERVGKLELANSSLSEMAVLGVGFLLPFALPLSFLLYLYDANAIENSSNTV